MLRVLEPVRRVAGGVGALAAGLLVAGCLRGPAPGPARRTAEGIAATAADLDADVWEATSPEAALAGLDDLLEDEVRAAGGRADVLVLLDASAAMFPVVRLLARSPEVFAGALGLGARVAVGSYRAYSDVFFLRAHPFTTDPAEIAARLERLRAWGGRRAREPLWGALAETLRGLDWDRARAPIVVIVTSAASYDEPGARAAARAWLAERGARVHLVRVLSSVRVALPSAPRVSGGAGVGVLARGVVSPVGAAARGALDSGALGLFLVHATLRTFRSLAIGIDLFATWTTGIRRIGFGPPTCLAAEYRASIRAGWDWPQLGFTAGVSLRSDSLGCERAHLGVPLVPAATLRIGPLSGLSVRAALFSADLEAVPGLPLVRAAVVYEGRRFRLGLGLGTLPPTGPAITYSLALRLPRRFGAWDLGVDAFAGIDADHADELAYGLTATLATRAWRWPWGR